MAYEPRRALDAAAVAKAASELGCDGMACDVTDEAQVIALVERLIDEGRAQCVLGNHELSLLRGKPGAGNAWFYGHDVKPKLDTHTFNEFKNATAEQRERALRFFARLPLALAERRLDEGKAGVGPTSAHSRDGGNPAIIKAGPPPARG